jgi:hypothetical protein
MSLEEWDYVLGKAKSENNAKYRYLLNRAESDKNLQIYLNEFDQREKERARKARRASKIDTYTRYVMQLLFFAASLGGIYAITSLTWNVFIWLLTYGT